MRYAIFLHGRFFSVCVRQMTGTNFFCLIQWYLANPHQFHLLALGTLHSLPSPVPRRSQKYFKPEFFSFLQKEKDAWDSVRTTKDWITANEMKEVRTSPNDGDLCD